MNKYQDNSLTNKEFKEIIKELIQNETVQSMKKYIQHCNTNCYDHCYKVSYYCYKISKKYNWDYKSAARGAMLHDLFLYNWREKNGRKGLHAFTHGKTSCENACNLFQLNEKEKNMIIRHMFPVTIVPPKSKEGMLLTIVDKYCTILEFCKYIYEEYCSNKKVFKFASSILEK